MPRPSILSVRLLGFFGPMGSEDCCPPAAIAAASTAKNHAPAASTANARAMSDGGRRIAMAGSCDRVAAAAEIDQPVMGGGVSAAGCNGTATGGPAGYWPAGTVAKGDSPPLGCQPPRPAAAAWAINHATKKAPIYSRATMTRLHSPAVKPIAQACPRTAYDRTSDTPAEIVVRPRSQRIEKRGMSIRPIVAQRG